MTIAVLMSVYKNEKADRLDRCMRSIWDDQTLKPNQIILVEDGPLPQGIHDVIDTWKTKLQEKLDLLVNEENLGLTKSLNKGIGVVKTDLIARMDSDDISEPQRFELQVKYLEKHPDIDILGGSLREFNDQNDCLRIRHYPLTHENALKYIAKASPLAHPTVMMRKKIFEMGLSYNEKYRTSQDIALWFDAIIAGFRISNISDITINFRSQGDVFKRRSRSKAWNEFKIYMYGIYRMHGAFSLLYRYPLSRLLFRLMPPSFVKKVYQSRMRTSFLDTK